jgi:flagellar biosynthesis/type III secretory pathway protein FliH
MAGDSEEGFWDTLYEKAQEQLPNFEELPEGWDAEGGIIVEMINLARDLAYNQGFQDGRYEATMEYEEKMEDMREPLELVTDKLAALLMNGPPEVRAEVERIQRERGKNVVDLHSAEVREALDRR